MLEAKSNLRCVFSKGSRGIISRQTTQSNSPKVVKSACIVFCWFISNTIEGYVDQPCIQYERIISTDTTAGRK